MLVRTGQLWCREEAQLRARAGAGTGRRAADLNHSVAVLGLVLELLQCRQAGVVDVFALLGSGVGLKERTGILKREAGSLLKRLFINSLQATTLVVVAGIPSRLAQVKRKLVVRCIPHTRSSVAYEAVPQGESSLAVNGCEAVNEVLRHLVAIRCERAIGEGRKNPSGEFGLGRNKSIERLVYICHESAFAIARVTLQGDNFLGR